jgi:uncharacterized protein
MSDDFNTAEQTRYVRADELASIGSPRGGGWLWPWGVAGLIGFLALTGFFMTLLRPSPKDVVPVNDSAIFTQPLEREPPVAAPLPTDSPLVAEPAINDVSLSADTAPVAAAAAPAITKADPVPALVGTTARIAILVMDLGGDPSTAKTAISQLPAQVDLGFTSADAGLMRQAMAGGHKVWLGIPMQPRRYPAIDPGPGTLLLKNSAAQNSKHLSTALAAAAPGVTGLYNIMGSAFTADRDALAPVMSIAQDNGLAFFDTRAGADTVAATLARSQAIPAVINDAYLDNDPAKLAQRLGELASRAKSRGVAIGVVSASSQSIAGLKAWLATPAGTSVELVSARSVAATAGLQKLQP